MLYSITDNLLNTYKILSDYIIIFNYYYYYFIIIVTKLFGVKNCVYRYDEHFARYLLYSASFHLKISGVSKRSKYIHNAFPNFETFKDTSLYQDSPGVETCNCKIFSTCDTLNGFAAFPRRISIWISLVPFISKCLLVV